MLVAAGPPVLRAGLARLLSWTDPGIEVVAEVGTAAEALEACADLRPDVALVDLGLPAGDTSGLPARGTPGPAAGACPATA